MNIAIVTDSTAYVQEQYLNHKNLFVLSVPLIIDDVVYQEGIDITDEEFYQKLKQAKEFPKTSQPALGEVYELYENLSKSGYDAVISIHLSTGISGFITTLNGISKDFSDIDIYPFDSYITSGPMGRMVEIALEMSEDESVEPQAILSHLEQMREYAEGYIVVDDLNHLVRGGRLKNGAAIIGTLLKIKPILRFEEGDIILSEKVRSQKKALSRAIDIVLGEVPSKPHDSIFYVIHCNNIEVATQVKQDMLARDNELEVILCDFGPVIGTHLGEKSVGLGVIPKK